MLKVKGKLESEENSDRFSLACVYETSIFNTLKKEKRRHNQRKK